MMLCPSLPEKIEIARIYGVEDDRYVAKKFGRLSWAFLVIKRRELFMYGVFGRDSLAG
jgi:hypothetical protein